MSSVATGRDGSEWDALAAHTGATYLRYSFTKGTEQEAAFLVEVLGLTAGDRVLDAGCGPGRHAAALGRRGVDVVGVDRARAFLEAAGPGRWVRADVRRLPVGGRSFDAAICLCQGGFGILGGDGDADALAEIAAAVRPGGKVAVSAFSSYFQVRHLEEGDRFDAATGVNHEDTTVLDGEGRAAPFELWTTCFTPRELRLMAGACGLRVDGLWSVGPGDYACRPPDLDHPEWLLVATVTGRS